MYQGICIANCESKASHPQGFHIKDIVMEWIELTDGYQHHIRVQTDGTILVYLN